MRFLFGQHRQCTNSHIRLPRMQKACSVDQQTLFSPETQRTKHVKCTASGADVWRHSNKQSHHGSIQHNSALTEPVNWGNPLGCRAVLLPWPQPLQALAEVVVEEEIQGLHTLIQTLFQGHRRGAATHKRHRSVTDCPLKLFCFWPKPHTA